MSKSPDTESFFAESHDPKVASDKERIGWELNPAQIDAYKDKFSDIDIQTNIDGRPTEFPDLGEKQKIVAELEFDGERRMFMCYNLTDLQTLFDSYVLNYRNSSQKERVGKIRWHLYSWAEKQ